MVAGELILITKLKGGVSRDHDVQGESWRQRRCRTGAKVGAPKLFSGSPSVRRAGAGDYRPGRPTGYDAYLRGRGQRPGRKSPNSTHAWPNVLG
jgi:hypothetical protein